MYESIYKKISRIGRFIETGKFSDHQGLRREWRMIVNGFGVSFWGDENVLELVVMVAKGKY